MKAKYLELVRVLERRVQAGDYALEQMPSERKLAAELGVSHMTARRAVQHLIETGLIKRNSTHSRSASAKSKLKIACLVPEFDPASIYVVTLIGTLTKVVTVKGGIVRPVSYTGWHDPVIMDVLDGDFDGIFFLPPNDMPQVMLDRLAREAGRIVTLYRPLIEQGILCIDNGKPDAVSGLVAHLADLGHRHIAMLNCNPEDLVVHERVAGWRDELARRGLAGPLFNDPVMPGEFCDRHALPYVEKLIDQGQLGKSSPVTAMITTTLETARASIRALANRGLSVPKDLSIATCDAPWTAKMMVPSITTLDCPPINDYVEIGLEWIMSRGQNWNRPMLVRTDHVPVWVGESTVPPQNNGR